MPHHPEWIEIHPLAPAKPQEGQTCNGCGVCCLAEPCPLGMLLSGKRRGACSALRWNNELARYRCGAIAMPTEVVGMALPWWLQWTGGLLTAVLARLAPRWIARGTGCDSSLQIDAAIRDNALHD